jgi:hypothetical protein
MACFHTELCCISISRFDSVRLVHSRCLPLGRQIQSAWKESGIVCFGKLCRFGNKLCALRSRSSCRMFGVHSTFCFRSCCLLAGNSSDSHPFHSWDIESFPPSLLFFQQKILPVSFFRDACRATSGRRIQRAHFQLRSEGFQCRTFHYYRCPHHIHTGIRHHAWHFASGMPALLLILVIVVALACSQNVLALASSPISLCVRNCCVEL